MSKPKNNVWELPNGTLFCYRKKLYFVSDGLEGRIVTGEDGNWKFIRELDWKTIRVLYYNYLGKKYDNSALQESIKFHDDERNKR